MKKILTHLIAPVFVMISLAACTKNEVTEVQKVDQAFSAVYTIRPADWETNDGGKSYSAELEVPELDNVIYQDGAVLAFLQFSGESYYEAIPQVFDGITYGVIHSDGYVVVDMSSITGGTINPPGQNVMAKIILIDAVRLALRKDVNLRDINAVQKAFVTP